MDVGTVRSCVLDGEIQIKSYVFEKVSTFW